MLRFRNLGLKIKIMLVVAIPYLGGLIVASSAGYWCYTSRDLAVRLQQGNNIATPLRTIEESVERLSRTIAAKPGADSHADTVSGDQEDGEISARLAELRNSFKDDAKQSAVLAELEAAVAAWRAEVVQPAGELRKSGRTDDTAAKQKIASQLETHRKRILGLVGKLSGSGSGSVEALAGEIVRKTGAAESMLLWGMVLVAVSAVFMIYLVSTSIIRPLIQAVNLAGLASRGELTKTVEVDRSDEMGLLVRSLNEMVDQLKGRNSKLIEVISVLVSTAQQVSAIVSDLNSDTNATSTAVSQTTSTVSELNQAAKLVSEKARDVAERSRESVKVSSGGRHASQATMTKMDVARQQMESVSTTVERLREQSMTIERIISAVQDLADQSNLLAVNASIEAARAGEQGRGFAVVAQEIKTLADQSKESTQEVRSILEDIRQRVNAVVGATDQGRKAVDDGAQQAALAGDSIRLIADNVEDSARAADIINASSAEQVVGVGQVAEAMENVKEAMNRNLQSANQLQSAIKNLEELGVSLKGMIELQTPDSTEHSKQELDIQVALGPAIMAARGYAAPEVEKAYSRAHELSSQVDEPKKQFNVLRGLWGYHIVRCELPKSQELARQCLDVAQRAGNQAFSIWAHFMLGMTLFHQGQLKTALDNFSKGLDAYDVNKRRAPRKLQDPGVACLSYQAPCLWLLGYPDQAQAKSREALKLARSLSHPFSEAYALGIAGLLSQVCQKVDETQERADAASAVCAEHGIRYWMAWGPVLRGWALTRQGNAREGIKQQLDGIKAYSETGAQLVRPYFLCTVVDSHLTAGNTRDGLDLVSTAITEADQTEEKWFEPELKRLKGELLLKENPEKTAPAEECFQQALEQARTQDSRSLELRSAVSLGRLLRSQNNHQKAKQIIEPIYSSFTEGFETTDLAEARTFLE